MGQISNFYRIAATYAPRRRTKAESKARRRRKMPYYDYLKTPYWAMVRAAAIERSGGACQACGAVDHLNVHHKTYAHRGNELHHLNDLTVYCRKCHARLHREPHED